MGDTDNGGGCACWRSRWEIFVTSFQFCYEPKSTLKKCNKKMKKKTQKTTKS